MSVNALNRFAKWVYFVGSLTSVLLSVWVYFAFQKASGSFVREESSRRESLEILSFNHQLTQSLYYISLSVSLRDQKSFDALMTKTTSLLKQAEGSLFLQFTSSEVKALQQQIVLLQSAYPKPREALMILGATSSALQKLSQKSLLEINSKYQEAELAATEWARGQVSIQNLLRTLFFVVSALLAFISVMQVVQRKTKKALEDSEQLNSLLIGSLKEAVILLKPDGRVVSCNQSAAVIVRRKKSEILGQSISKLFPKLLKKNGQIFKSQLHPFLTLALSQQAFQQVVVGIPHPIRKQWLSLNIQPLALEGFESGTALISMSDITDLIESQEQLKAQQAQLIQSSKMSALGEMAAGIAHEINNPLAIIQSEADTILEALEDKDLAVDELAGSSEKIISTVNRISKIIKGLRTFSRDGRQDPFSKENLNSILTDATQLTAAKVKNFGINLQVVLADDLQLECRPTQIAQVLVNLIQNSADAIEGKAEKWIRIEARVLKQNIEIQITDSGDGIPGDVVERLFQPFFTTKAIGKGTGLGLSISKGIIESHHGKMFVDQACKNTRFVIQLPIRQIAA